MNKKFGFILFCLTSVFVALGCGLSSQVAPSAEPAFNPTSIPGWEKFEGKGVELWLPESFEGGDIDNDIDIIVDKLKSLDPGFESIAENIRQNKDMFAIWTFDSEIGSTGGLTSVSVTTEKILSSMSIETYIDAAEKQFPSQFQIVAREPATLDRYEASRLLIDFNAGASTVKEAMYIIKDGNTIWNITFGTPEDEWEQRLPVFEQSANTFLIQP